MITDIYNSKSIYDKRCEQNNIVQENMEEHMYTFLNQKYGLRSITINHANSIIQAIKKYSKEDFESLMFGKFLRNTLPEVYKDIARDLESQLSSFVKDRKDSK